MMEQLYKEHSLIVHGLVFQYASQPGVPAHDYAGNRPSILYEDPSIILEDIPPLVKIF
ncbi:hypothetical protein EXN66_Car022123 [Channa argus]|uniref:Uncharacterized protein n=1 Tax=Channa argus TaxID=215402 RepID=A0A6G1QUQ4_CHAAH|nr:hypothetical protein EXN66_Car022123 [Channa argus]